MSAVELYEQSIRRLPPAQRLELASLILNDLVSRPVNPLDIRSRLDAMRALKPGWLEGTGVVPNPIGLTWLADAFATGYPGDVPLPHLYPTPEGGIRAEWSLEPFEVSVDIDLANHGGAWHALNLENDSETTDRFDLDRGDEWNRLADRIRSLRGGKP